MEWMIEAYAAPRPEFGGVGYVINQVDQSRQLTKDVLKVLRHLLGEKLFPGVIPMAASRMTSRVRLAYSITARMRRLTSRSATAPQQDSRARCPTHT
jgi:hypothetical protein